MHFLQIFESACCYSNSQRTTGVAKASEKSEVEGLVLSEYAVYKITKIQR